MSTVEHAAQSAGDAHARLRVSATELGVAERWKRPLQGQAGGGGVPVRRRCSGWSRAQPWRLVMLTHTPRRILHW